MQNWQAVDLVISSPKLDERAYITTGSCKNAEIYSENFQKVAL